jgi:hypothetical protein
MVLGLYVPGSSVRLLSSQDYISPLAINQYGGNSTEFWMNLQDDKGVLRAPIVSGSKLPILAVRHVDSTCHCHTSSSFSSTIDSYHSTNVFNLKNQNLTSTRKQLLLSHCRRGHLGSQLQQSLYQILKHILGSSEQGVSSIKSCLLPKVPGLSTCSIPGCKACYLSKEKRRPTPGKISTTDHCSAGV